MLNNCVFRTRDAYVFLICPIKDSKIDNLITKTLSVLNFFLYLVNQIGKPV